MAFDQISSALKGEQTSPRPPDDTHDLSISMQIRLKRSKLCFQQVSLTESQDWSKMFQTSSNFEATTATLKLDMPLKTDN